jgi:uncharacterized membrane protein YdbT with pleckstrin-like domain
MPEPPDIPKELTRYLSPYERVVLVQRRHWIVVAEPVLTAIGGLIVLGWLASVLQSAPDVLDFLVIAYLVLVIRAVWLVFDWRRDLFIATNARLINTYGLVTRKVATMPLTKVTDLSYIRTPGGKLLGWGTFRLESAGQDQALSTIRYVVDPDATYRKIATQLFKPKKDAAAQSTQSAQPSAPASAAPTSSASSSSRLPVEDPDEAWWRREA